MPKICSTCAGMTQNLNPSRSLLGCRVQAVRSILQLQHVKPPCRGLICTPLPPTKCLQRGWSRSWCRWFALPCHRSMQASNSHLASAVTVTPYCCCWFIRCLSYAIGRHIEGRNRYFHGCCFHKHCR